jgi:hypothetical protein
MSFLGSQPKNPFLFPNPKGREWVFRQKYLQLGLYDSKRSLNKFRMTGVKKKKPKSKGSRLICFLDLVLVSYFFSGKSKSKI